MQKEANAAVLKLLCLESLLASLAFGWHLGTWLVNSYLY